MAVEVLAGRPFRTSGGGKIAAPCAPLGRPHPTLCRKGRMRLGGQDVAERCPGLFIASVVAARLQGAGLLRYVERLPQD